MSENDSQNSIASDFSTRQQCSKLGSRGKLNSSLPCRWESMFEKLMAYKQKYGNCLVPNRYAKDRSLGSWVSTQRRYFKLMNSSESMGNSKNPKVNEMRIAKLHDIGFVWAASDPRHTPWETRFQELCEYKERHGNVLVPIGYKENNQLANWVSTQRQAYKAFIEGRATTITSARIWRLESIGMVWDAQKGGNRKRKNCEGMDDSLLASDRKVSFSLCADQNENTSGNMKMSKIKKRFSKFHDHEIQECKEDGLKNVEITNVEEIVNNSFKSCRHDSESKNQALKICCGSAVKKAAKNYVRDDGDCATLLNLNSIRNKNASTSLSTAKYCPLLHPRSMASKIVDAQHNASKTVEHNAINPSPSKNSFVRKFKGIGNHEFNRFNGLHCSERTGLAFNNGDSTSQSGNCRPSLSFGYPLKEAKRNHDNIGIESLPRMTKGQRVQKDFRNVDTDHSTSEITNARSNGCESITTKPSEVLLLEALKAGWELTTHMPAESIEEVNFFLETMKWRNAMNVLMALQDETLF